MVLIPKELDVVICGIGYRAFDDHEPPVSDLTRKTLAAERDILRLGLKGHNPVAFLQIEIGILPAVQADVIDQVIMFWCR